jgi:serine/threonine protein kinase/Flp pilus assembly protein TadD
VSDDNCQAPHDLDAIVESYELAQQTRGNAHLEDFLPAADHPEYVRIVCELIRVDLEYGWVRGTPLRLEDYQSRFSAVFERSDAIAQIAFEEFRQRRQAGEAVSRNDYAVRYAIDVSDWPQGSTPGADRRDDPQALNPKPAVAILEDEESGTVAFPTGSWSDLESRLGASGNPETAAPRPGERFAGFEIVRELGHGASARVFLARQHSLANRHVVLKVTSQRTVEPDRLARLQHTNIVPIYSAHETGGLSVLCMPFVGSCTLRDWVDQLRMLQNLPATGSELVSTLAAASGRTWRERESAPAQGPQAPSPGPTGDRDQMSARALAALSQLEQATYEHVILLLAAQTAAGLAHAHDQGVLHLDLKPANILLTDDGRPMLLDFHLAIVAGPEGPTAHFAGGTLPYMSPEQLQSLDRFQRLDERSDLFSFGVVFHELLTGRLPFPERTGRMDEVIAGMLSDRQRWPALLRPNRQISPATWAIVRHCLDPDPGRRYQSAHELLDDLQRQLSSRPLKFAGNPSLVERFRKWVRRHPRATSSAALLVAACVIAVAVAAVLIVREETSATLAAGRALEHFEAAFPEAKALLSLPIEDPAELAAETARAHELLRGFEPLEKDTWRDGRLYRRLDATQRARLDSQVGELLYLLAAPRKRPIGTNPLSAEDRASFDEELALNAQALSCFPKDHIPAALWKQRARLLELSGQAAAAEQARANIDRANIDRANTDRSSAPGSIDRILEAEDLVLGADFRNAAPLLDRLKFASPKDFSTWYLSGNACFALHDYSGAEAAFSACIPLRPDSYRAYYQRGICRLNLGKFEPAREDFDYVLQLKPDALAAVVSRALTWQGEGKLPEALADLTRAIDLGFPETRVYFMRAEIHEKLGNRQDAERDRREGLERMPTDPRSWVARGVARIDREPEEALEDFRSALALNPREFAAWRNVAHTLSERLGRPQEAIEALDRLLQMTADDPGAWAGRGVLLARKGRADAARADAQQALAIRRDALTVYQAACIEALASKDNGEAVQRALPLLAESLLKQMDLAELALADPDLERLRPSQAFRNLIAAARFLVAAPGNTGSRPGGPAERTSAPSTENDEARSSK